MANQTVTILMTATFLMSLGGGCSQSAMTQKNEMPAVDKFAVYEGVIPEGNQYIIGDNSIVIAPDYPDEEEPEVDVKEETEPMFVLPDGTQVPEKDVQTQEDGTVVVSLRHGHKCYFTDGTYAVTRYTNSSREVCEYTEAAKVFVDWYYANGEVWREEEYLVQESGELFVIRRYEHEYTPIEIGTEDSPVYRSATTELIYDETDNTYKTGYSEYDSLHGPEKPIKSIHYDGSYCLNEYNLDGTLERSDYFSAEGLRTQVDIYDHGVMEATYLYYEDGRTSWERYYENGVLSSEINHSPDGDVTTYYYYKEGKCVRAEAYWDDGRRRTTEMDEDGNISKEIFNNADGSYNGKILYEYDTDGSVTVTYYDANDNITNVEHYD